MTNAQEMMLTICFGCCIGAFIGNLISIISFIFSDIKAKRRKHKKDNESAKNVE